MAKFEPAPGMAGMDFSQMPFSPMMALPTGDPRDLRHCRRASLRPWLGAWRRTTPTPLWCGEHVGLELGIVVLALRALVVFWDQRGFLVTFDIHVPSSWTVLIILCLVHLMYSYTVSMKLLQLILQYVCDNVVGSGITVEISMDFRSPWVYPKHPWSTHNPWISTRGCGYFATHIHDRYGLEFERGKSMGMGVGQPMDYPCSALP